MTAAAVSAPGDLPVIAGGAGRDAVPVFATLGPGAMVTAMNDTLFLGIDGGGSGCRARLADGAGRMLGEGSAGAANPRFGFEAATTAIVEAAQAAAAAAGLPVEALGQMRAGLGLAGVGQRRDRERLLGWCHPFAAMALETDAHIACLGAHGGGDGAVLVVGTGSCGVALAGGREHRVGGWGFPISDQGSGAWLGLEALRQALWAQDGIAPATGLTRAVMAQFGGDPERAVAWLDRAVPRDYAALAPLVLDHGGQGDAVAMALLAQAGADLARLLAALRRIGAPRLALLGGLAGPLRPWLPEDARAGLDPPLGDALDGALCLARRTLD